MTYKVLFSCVTGSHLHGTTTPASDVDARVIYRDSLKDRLSPLPLQTKTRTDQDTDTTYFELTHFAHMILKCNPTSMEILYGVDQEGDTSLLRALRDVALDTDLYLKHCNGMIMNMLTRATPKRLHHAARVHTHLTKYAESGIIDFNAKNYENYDYLMAIKRGEADLEPKYLEKVYSDRVWHTQDRSAIERIVIEEYLEDAR